MKQATVICGFPACGKTYLVKNNKDKLIILDSDSSAYSWIVERRLDGERTRNPDFPANYIQHIQDNLDKADLILVSSHEAVRDALHKAGIPFIIVCPHRDRKSEWIERCIMRGDNNAFLKVLLTNWDEWIKQIKAEEKAGVKVVWLRKGQTLSSPW